MDTPFEQARDFFLAGIGHYEAGRYAQAEKQFEASLSLVPGRASTLTNLGATRLKLGKFEEAAEVLQEAIAKEPDDVEALGNCATALAELGQSEGALDLADRAIARDATRPVLWTLRGNLLRERGRHQEAAASFEEAIRRGGDAELLGYYAAAVRGDAPPARPPRTYVESLFDSYAEGFEQHLVEVLKYDAPRVLAAKLAGREYALALDLGCGTGLCGVQLRPLARRLEGVDLSARMVAAARARGCYDDVRQADAVADLQAAAPSSVDLLVAADVFIYLGALDDVFAAAARALVPGGVFCFTVELEDDARDFALRTSLRYAHSRRYIRTLAQQNGFEFRATAEHPIRDDQRTPIPGWFAWLVKP